MRKCIDKSKGKEGAATMEVNAHTPLGVRTRSMSLEVKHIQILPASPSVASAAIGDGGDGGSYLQLRSRWVKRSSPIRAKAKSPKQLKKGSTSESPDKRPTRENQESEKDKGKGPMLEENETEQKNISPDDLKGIEASCGENDLEFEKSERATRESTPVHLIRDPEALGTPPGSTTKRRYMTNTTRATTPMQFFAPATDVVNAFFADLVKKDKNKCIEKYNFDPEKDEPLPGRFEWEKLKP